MEALQLEGWAQVNTIKYRLIDATGLLVSIDLLLRNLIHSGIPLWAEGDLVHHTQDAYRELAEVFMEGDYSDGLRPESPSPRTVRI